MLVFLAVLSFILFICLLPLIGLWKAYEKAGEAGWKAIIPLYNVLIMSRITFKTMRFGGLLLLYAFIVGIMFGIFTNLGGILYFIGLLLYLSMIVLSVYFQYRFMQCYNFGLGFTILTIVLPPFMIRLASSDVKYHGPIENDKIAEFISR